VSTPTNNTKPRSNCQPSGDSLAGSRPSLQLADAAVDGGQGGGLVTLTHVGLNRFALPAHRGMRQPVLDQHRKSARSRLSLPRATGRVGTPVPAPLVCALRGPGPPGTCPRNSREREGAVVVGWCGNGDLLGERADVVQPVRDGSFSSNPAGPRVSRAYVLCAQGKEDQALPGYVERARSDPGWRS
jgi:hypothetical protein